MVNANRVVFNIWYIPTAHEQYSIVMHAQVMAALLDVSAHLCHQPRRHHQLDNLAKVALCASPQMIQRTAISKCSMLICC
jgi:hypothetical protein